MKLLHTSDWHLGITYKAGMSFELDQKFVINEICKTAVEEKVDGILIAGDVFDKSIASQEGLRLYDEVITYICTNLNIPVYIIAGNHDSADRISQCKELLKKSGLYIVGKLTKEVQLVNNGDVDIYMLPWISTDKVKTVFSDDADNIKSLEDAYKIVLDKYRASFVPGHKNILIAHAFIVNAETSTSDKAAEVGMATMVGSYVFDGFDYVALGHLHAPQQIGDHIRYSGTPMAYSFGKEEKQIKSVTIVDTDTSEQTIIPIKQRRKRISLVGTFDEIINGDYDAETIDAYVKIEITDQYVGLESISQLRVKFPNLLEVTGKSFEREDAKITMTMEEYEHIQETPEVLFARFCEDVIGESPSQHFMDLFNEAVNKYEKEVNE